MKRVHLCSIIWFQYFVWIKKIGAVVGDVANARSTQDIGALQTAAHGNARIGAHPHTRRRVQTCPPLRLQVLIACPIAEGAASEKQEIG